MITIGIGETVYLPARTIDEGMLRAKVDWARSHNLPGSVDLGLRAGDKAKILRAYARNDRNAPSVIIADHNGDQVAVRGLTRGTAYIDIVDEISAPGGITGMAGGEQVIVEDELDRATRQQRSAR